MLWSQSCVPPCFEQMVGPATFWGTLQAEFLGFLIAGLSSLVPKDIKMFWAVLDEDEGPFPNWK